MVADIGQAMIATGAVVLIVHLAWAALFGGVGDDFDWRQ